MVSERILEEMVRRVVRATQPLRILLFGSAARGETGTNSDLDILVVVPDGTHRRQAAQAIYRDLSDLGVPKDVVVVTESDLREHGNNPSLVLFSALREGRELYHVAG